MILRGGYEHLGFKMTEKQRAQISIFDNNARNGKRKLVRNYQLFAYRAFFARFYKHFPLVFVK